MKSAPKKTAKKATATKATAKKPTAKKATAKKPTAKKATAKKPTAKKATAKQPSPRKPGSRADLGAPIDGFFAKQPAHLRAILVELRGIVESITPDASSSIKWGMPFFEVNGAMMCALGAHKSHVNLILSGPPDAFPDPDGRLSGEGKSGRHLKLTAPADLPRAAVRRWLRIAADLARRKGAR